MTDVCDVGEQPVIVNVRGHDSEGSKGEAVSERALVVGRSAECDNCDDQIFLCRLNL